MELPRPKKKFLKADYQSKRCTMTVPAEAPAFECHENISYQFVTYEAMFTGWNPTGAEVSLSKKSRLWCTKGTIDLKALYFLHSGTYRL